MSRFKCNFYFEKLELSEDFRLYLLPTITFEKGRGEVGEHGKWCALHLSILHMSLIFEIEYGS
jgi:hypothetical protein